jgi:hypothetical protein
MALEVMFAKRNLNWTWLSRVFWLIASCVAYSSSLPLQAQIQLPAIDPTGTRIFTPGSTTLLGPFHSGQTGRSGLFQHHNAPGDQHPGVHGSIFGRSNTNTSPVEPAFKHPGSNISSCAGDGKCGPSCKHIIPKINLPERPGKAGEIILTPSRIIAPVGSEVVVLAGLCGGDGHFVLNQPLEWMISNDSVGQLIEVGGMEHPTFNRMVPPTSKKFDGQYATGRTGLKEKVVTRGTPTPCDDIDLVKGQTYVSVASASPGTTYLTAVAPKAAGWDKRRATTIIHWVDGVWSIPLPVRATSGTLQPLTTTVARVSDSKGIPNWKIRYSIVDGAPAEFAPTGSQQAEVETNTEGQGTVQIRQQAGKLTPGTTNVRVDVIRPSMLGEPELVVESGVTSVTWSSPALAITAKGPESAALNQAYNYRLEITNPGDQIAQSVIVRTDDFTEDLKFISSNPKPAEYGRSLQWDLGNINPGEPPRIIDIQMKGESRGMKRLCFTVESQTDRLSTEACAETEVAAPCLGLEITGNTGGVVGQQATFNIDIFNQCDEPLENVKLTASYEAGLSVPGMGNPITMEIGRLEFGEHRQVPLIFDLASPGDQCFILSVTADGNHTATSRRCIEVRQASVGSATLKVEGAPLVQLNDRVEARVRIANNGNTPLRDVIIVNKFSPSLRPESSTDGISVRWADNDLLFGISEIPPGQEVSLVVTYIAADVDGNAFSQFSMTQPLQVEDRLPLRIDQRVGGGQPSPNGPIGIPNDPAGGLSVQVTSPANTIAANNSDKARVAFKVKNTRATPLRNVEVLMLVPTGLTLVGFDDQDRVLQIDTARSNNRQYFIQTRKELRAGEELSFLADVSGDRPGQMLFEVHAISADTTNAERGQATINVTPAQ